jgi:hypothetical protein
VEGEFVDALPLGILLAVDEDMAVVGGAGEDGAVFGMCPGDTPDSAFMPTNLSEETSVMVLLCVPFQCLC